MGINNEISIIKLLLCTEKSELAQHKDKFTAILQALELSHTDSGFFELEEENDKYFIEFHEWLKEVKHMYKIDISDYSIESFSLTSHSVKELMNK